MQPLPHTYHVKATGGSNEHITTTCTDKPAIECAPPIQFGGPGDRWTPEDLLLAAVADCFILSFKAVARMAKLDWDSIECETSGELDKVERKLRFTRVHTHAKLRLPAGADKEKAEQLLQKAEDSCLITNSLAAPAHLNYEVVVASS